MGSARDNVFVKLCKDSAAAPLHRSRCAEDARQAGCTEDARQAGCTEDARQAGCARALIQLLPPNFGYGGSTRPSISVMFALQCGLF